MIIENPEILWFLLLIIPLAILSFYTYSSGKQDIKKLGGKWMIESILNIYLVKHFFIFLFFVLFFIFSIFALADFKWGKKLTTDDREGYDIVFVIDISRSMLAEDIQPTRLKKATEKINSLIDEMWDAKFGIVIFKGKAVRVWPITDDFEAIKLFLNTVNPNLITVPGSNIEDAIDIALKTFHKAGRYKSIILLSDGENLQGNPENAARKAKEIGVPIISVVCGTNSGIKIILENGKFIKNKAGEKVVSRANRKLLKEIASLSGGKYYELWNADRINDELLSIVTDIEDENIGKGLKLVKNEGYKIFTSLSILFLFFSLLVRGIKWQNII